MKSYLKNTYNHTAKHVLRWWNKNSIYFVTLFTRETSYQEDCIVSYPSIVLYASTLASKPLSVKITLSKLLSVENVNLFSKVSKQTTTLTR
jgi:hypothetical protein